MKKIISFFIAIIVLLFACGCSAIDAAPSCDITPDFVPTNAPENTPRPVIEKPEADTIIISDIADYAIVYPSELPEWRKEDVDFLAATIEKIYGKKIDVIPDSEPERKHEIILASSSRETAFDEYIDSFESRLDYVIAAKDGDLILGGQDYWGDLRAIYAFINDWLGYDDVDDVYSTPKTELSGFNEIIYKKPKMTIFGCNAAVDPFVEISVFRDMHEANFNMMEIQSGYTQEQIRNLVKWCTRFEIWLMFTLTYYIEDWKDCPIIWGLYVWDEPLQENMLQAYDKCEEFYEQYGDLGWEAGINMFGFKQYWEVIANFQEMFPGINKMSFDHYIGHSVLKNPRQVLHIYEYAKEYADKNGIEFWNYIESQEIYAKKQNTSKMFLWSATIALCFGSTGTMYFQYGDASGNAMWDAELEHGALIEKDGARTPAWYDAKKANAVLLKMGEILDDYEYLGTYTENCPCSDSPDDPVYLESPYPFFGSVLEEIIDTSNDRKKPLLIGCYEKKNKSGYSFILMNIEDLNDVPYDETAADDELKLKINGENVKFYRDTVEYEVKKDENGYYHLGIGNGFEWFVTVD